MKLVPVVGKKKLTVSEYCSKSEPQFSLAGRTNALNASLKNSSSHSAVTEGHRAIRSELDSPESRPSICVIGNGGQKTTGWRKDLWGRYIP
jgi:hypothetical protein